MHAFVRTVIGGFLHDASVSDDAPAPRARDLPRGQPPLRVVRGELFRERRFRRGAAPFSEATSLLPHMVRDVLDGRHLGSDPGRDSSVPRRDVSTGSHLGSDVDRCQPCDEHRLPRRERAARAGHRPRRCGCERHRLDLRRARLCRLAAPCRKRRVDHRQGRHDPGIVLSRFVPVVRAVAPRRGEVDTALRVLASLVLLCSLQQAEHHHHGGDALPLRSRGRARADSRLFVAGALRALRGFDDRVSAPALRAVWRGRAGRTTDGRWTWRLANLRRKALPAHVLRRRGFPVPVRLHRGAARDCSCLAPLACLRRREPAPRIVQGPVPSGRAGGF